MVSSDPQTSRPSRNPLALARHVWALTLGTVHGAWRLWRHRSRNEAQTGPPAAETAASPGTDRPTPDEQPEVEGAGPRFRRRFSIRVPNPERKAADVMGDAQADPNCIAPEGFASFHKEEGEPGRMQSGDVYLVDLLGPWTNRVRVVDTTPTSFRLATLQGHVEAGHVDISVTDRDDGLEVEVRTHTRSGDSVLDVLYDRLHVVRLLQTEMWSQVCEHAAALAGGQADPLRIEDVRLSDVDNPDRT